MEPENPSRRKKSGDEPVTIDLEAVPASGEEIRPPAEEPVAEETMPAAETASETPPEQEDQV